MARYNKSLLCCVLLTWCVGILCQARAGEVRIGQLVAGNPLARQYPNALPSLLREAMRQTTLAVAPEPVLLSSFADDRLFELPFIYVNFDDRKDWHFTPEECDHLRRYLENGGFIFVDAGITAAFLREIPGNRQHHNYAEWEECPELREAFKQVFPELAFTPLRRDDSLFSILYEGLPDASILPDSVRDYTVNEKWPSGTLSVVCLHVNGRPAVIATPIVAMGWGRDQFGHWDSTIHFRTLEGAEKLEDVLSQTEYRGNRFEARREDGLTDILYCRSGNELSWAQEPGGRWRVFRYHSSPEISQFAHEFFTRLGLNILCYGVLGD